MTYILIACGGALGAMARYLLGTTVQGMLRDANFPLGTLVVNLVGCFFIGLIMGFVEFRGSVNNDGRLFLVVGVLGGFTTFSSFGYETFQLLREGQAASAFINVFVQTGAGLVLVWIGNVVSRL